MTNNNPINNRPCLNCENMEVVDIEFDSGISDYHTGEIVYRVSKSFYCKAKNILMMSLKIERKHENNYVLLKNEEIEIKPEKESIIEHETKLEEEKVIEPEKEKKIEGQSNSTEKI